MNVILEEAGGMRLEVTEMTSVSQDTRAIILCLSMRVSEELRNQLKAYVEAELGKKCIVFGPEVSMVLGVK